MRDAALQRCELSVGDEYLAILRDDDGLRGELLLDANGASVGANAHGAGGIEADEYILAGIANRERFGLNLRGVDGESGLGFDARVNDAGIQCNGEQIDGFENRKVRGAADGDLAAFDEVDASLPGVDANVAATAQDCFCAALHYFNVEWALDVDGFAFDGTHGVVGGLVCASWRGNQQRGE